MQRYYCENAESIGLLTRYAKEQKSPAKQHLNTIVERFYNSCQKEIFYVVGDCTNYLHHIGEIKILGLNEAS
jgi:hypothetical protein